MKKQWSVLACVGFVSAASAAFADADSVVGRWYTEGEESQVEIYKVEENGTVTYDGKLVWFENPVYEADDPEAGKPLRDRENPDEARQNDPLLGLVILKDFVYDADSEEWSEGTIYDPEVGKNYKCVMRLGENDGTLDVRGYIGIPALGRTTQWVRVTDENDRMQSTD